MTIYKKNCNSAMLSSSVFIIYLVSGLFVPFVKDPIVFTREVSSAYVMNVKYWLVRNR